MGFLSDLVGAFTGSSARDASRAQIEEAEKSKQFIKEGIDRARGDVGKFGEGARESQAQGFQDALNIFSQTLPQQAGLFQQGNVGAQQALLAGLPQMNNAILGRQVDYSAMQPQQFDFNMDFAQSNQPQGMPQAVAPQVQAPAPNQMGSLAALLAGEGVNMPQYLTQNDGQGFVGKFPSLSNPLAGGAFAPRYLP